MPHFKCIVCLCRICALVNALARGYYFFLYSTYAAQINVTNTLQIDYYVYFMVVGVQTTRSN